jgi:acyl-CoA thioesterase-1
MPDAPPNCDPHLDIVRFEGKLPHLAESLDSRRRTRIVAIGSSSTAGENDVIPYPHRLELALRKRFPDRMIDVLNRGIGGQEAPEEVPRFETDVMAEDPSLVIWQVGTNAIFHRSLYDPGRVAATIATGLNWLKGLRADIVLMDLQYAPALLDLEKDTRLMVSLIAAAARTAGANLFRRFALMERWRTQDGIPMEMLISPDRLHQTDYSTNCVTQALDAAIGAALAPVPPST